MKPNNDTATLAYIRHVVQELGISATALAKQAGISATTLTRPLNSQKYKFNLSATTIEKIAKVSGINPGPFFDNNDYASITLASIHDKNAYDPEIWDTNTFEPLNSTVVIGSAALGFWQEIGKTSTADHLIFLRASNYDAADCFGVYLNDSHAGDFAYMGDYLFCIRFGAYKHEIVSGRTVLLERRRDNGRLIELTARRVQKVKTGWQLNTIGRGRLLQDQVVLTDLPGTDEAVVIGVVEYAVRRA